MQDNAQRRRKKAVDDNNDNNRSGELTMECSGKYCKSCTAGLIADCVALCCCPCALISIFTLAFVKVPFLVGRRCWVRAKRKWKKKCSEGGLDRVGEEVEREGSFRRRKEGRLQEEMWPNSCVFEDETVFRFEEDEGSKRFVEAEKVWLELYDQFGHLGFGRVSFSGSISFHDVEYCKGN